MTCHVYLYIFLKVVYTCLKIPQIFLFTRVVYFTKIKGVFLESLNFCSLRGRVGGRGEWRRGQYIVSGPYLDLCKQKTSGDLSVQRSRRRLRTFRHV